LKESVKRQRKDMAIGMAAKTKEIVAGGKRDLHGNLPEGAKEHH
jgi:hypothetical protein